MYGKNTKLTSRTLRKLERTTTLIAEHIIIYKRASHYYSYVKITIFSI